MGCGIIKESIFEKEWEESVNKLMMMKRVLNIREQSKENRVKNIEKIKVGFQYF